jgi:hypothetical protein
LTLAWSSLFHCNLGLIRLDLHFGLVLPDIYVDLGFIICTTDAVTCFSSRITGPVISAVRHVTI